MVYTKELHQDIFYGTAQEQKELTTPTPDSNPRISKHINSFIKIVNIKSDTSFF